MLAHPTPLSTFITGTAGADTLVGTSGFDEIHGADGDDLIRGMGGVDDLYGDAGDDRIEGGADDDGLSGGQGDDLLYGQAGNDFLVGGYETGADRCDGGNGDDTVQGGAGDTLIGGKGVDYFVLSFVADTDFDVDLSSFKADKGLTFAGGTVVRTVEDGFIHFGSGDDLIRMGRSGLGVNGGDGADTIKGGRGDDAFAGGAGNDLLLGGLGVDTLLCRNSGATVSLAIRGAQDTGADGIDVIKGFENITGGYGADHLTGDAGDNLLVGEVGNDTLIGGDGDDTLLGFSQIGPDAGDDMLIGGGGQDSMTGLNGVDTFVFLALADSTVAAPDTISWLEDGSGPQWWIKDVIDLSAIDANTSKAGDQAFVKVAAFTGKAGQLQLVLSGDDTWLELDVNGDKIADFRVVIEGDARNFDNFVL